MKTRGILTIAAVGVVALAVPHLLAQEPPPMARILNISTYSDFIVGWWENSNEVLQQKIALADSLYQMPDSFYAAEQALNDQLQAWQDSVMAEISTDIESFLKFGVEHKKKIETFLEKTGMQQQLDSLQQANYALFGEYENRLQGYNLAGPGE